MARGCFDSFLKAPLILSLPFNRPGARNSVYGNQKAEGKAPELTFRGKLSRYLTGQVQYTLSKTHNNTSGITFFPADSFDPAKEWARPDLDRRHKLDLPGSSEPTRFFTLGFGLSVYLGLPVNCRRGHR